MLDLLQAERWDPSRIPLLLLACSPLKRGLLAISARQFPFGDTQHTWTSPSYVKRELTSHAMETKLNCCGLPGGGEVWGRTCLAGTEPAQAVFSLLSELLAAAQFSWEEIYSKEVGEAKWN